VEGIDRDVVFGDVAPPLARGPISQGINFDQVWIPWVRPYERNLGAFGRLVATYRRDPGSEALNGGVQRGELAEGTAVIRTTCVERATVAGFHLCRRLGGAHEPNRQAIALL
jgi:hypothetical protein